MAGAECLLFFFPAPELFGFDFLNPYAKAPSSDSSGSAQTRNPRKIFRTLGITKRKSQAGAALRSRLQAPREIDPRYRNHAHGRGQRENRHLHQPHPGPRPHRQESRRYLARAVARTRFWNKRRRRGWRPLANRAKRENQSPFSRR